jgi:hypothetical protein
MGETTRPDPLAEWRTYRDDRLVRCGICTQVTAGTPHDEDCPVALGDAIAAELVAARHAIEEIMEEATTRLGGVFGVTFSKPEYRDAVEAAAPSPEQETREP